MNRKLIATLASACTLAAVLAGAATASAATLTLNDSFGMPSSTATFEGVSFYSYGAFTYSCDEFTLGAEITQNEANPVALQEWTGGYLPLAIDGCKNAINNTISYPSVELNGPMTFNADGTGSLPLLVTEVYHNGFGTANCWRAGVLDLTYNPNQTGSEVDFMGDMPGSGKCPAGQTTTWVGSFSAPTDEYLGLIDWVVTP